VFINKNITFVATGFYGLFTIYLLWCVQKGNISFGLRIPFITSFHPMKKDETYLNSFLFNINLMLLASLGITQFSVYAFNIYTQSSYLGKQFQQI
jgi:LMBR1 domain-containing protein 1